MTLEALVAEARARWERKTNPDRPRVIISAGSCGIFAGARKVKAAVVDALKRLHIDASVEKTGCVGLCWAEPMVDIQLPGKPRVAYGPLTPAEAAQLIEDVIGRGNPRVDKALYVYADAPYEGIPPRDQTDWFKFQYRITQRNAGIIDPEDLDDYLANGGYEGLARALTMTPAEVVDAVKKSGLRGCGGAAFPTGLKWEFCLRARGAEKYVICNADEGNAGTWKDRLIMEGDPFQLIEGITIAAYANGASRGFIYIRDEYPLASSRVRTAVEKLRARGLLGDNILGSNFSFDLVVRDGAGSYLCGEEMGLISSVEGDRAMPRSRPPFPATNGLFYKPTVVNNVETLANVPQIIARGWEWYAGLGTERSKGVRTITVSGAVRRPGGFELPFGVPLRTIILDLAQADPTDLKAVQMGGPASNILPADFVLTLPLGLDELRDAGTTMGSGGLVMVGQKTCIPNLVLQLMEFLRDESCGKCFPCQMGTRAYYNTLLRICRGEGRPEDLDFMLDIAPAIQFGSLCGHGQVAHVPVVDTITHFRHEYDVHIRERRCPQGVCEMSPVAAAV
jgi:NADH-quinone oxidoreductase subunit F